MWREGCNKDGYGWEPVPLVIEKLEQANIVMIASGFCAQHAVAVSGASLVNVQEEEGCASHAAVVSTTDLSDIYVWGRGDCGQLGLDPEDEFTLEDKCVVRST